MIRAGILAALVTLLSAQTRIGDEERLQIGGDLIIEFSSTPSPSLHQLILDWVNSSARAVRVYYGKFPVRQVHLRIRLFPGRGVRSGNTNGWNGARMRIAVGEQNSAADFAGDWMLTHEMVHLSFPSVAQAHHWIEEGIATYVEPIARARAGNLTAEKVWGDLVDGLPQGLPEPGDRGLDFTPTWGRTYWGGALFCLLADIEIRKRTGNIKGLEDALRAILNAGGTIESEWPLQKALHIGDQATGLTVLNDLYEKMRASPAPIDLNALWQQLGVVRKGDRTLFDDAAPLASIRRAITLNR